MKRGSNVVSKLITEVKEGLDICQDASNHLSEYNEEIRNHDTEDDRRVNLEQIQFLLEKKKKKTGFIFSSIIKTSAGATPLKAAKIGIQNNKNKQSKSWKPKFRKFQSPAGTTILAGRNSRENDAISFQVACDGDIWMHARGYPGAHVLVIARRGSSQPTEEVSLSYKTLYLFVFYFNNVTIVSLLRSHDRQIKLYCHFLWYI